MTARRTAERQFGVRGQWGMLAFVLLALAAIAAVLLLLVRGGGGADVPYSVRSNGPSGLMGLKLWLEDMGYKVTVGRTLEPGLGDVTFLFPDADLDAGEVRRLDDLVEGGRTLVIAGADSIDLNSRFGVFVQQSQPIVDRPLRPTQPLFPPSAVDDRPVSARSLSKLPGSHLMPILQTEDGKAAVLLEQRGKGTVWHVGIRGAFTNDDLRRGWGWALTVAALRGKPGGSTVYIMNGETEGLNSRLAARPTGPDGLWEWMLRHPVGWAALLLTALVLLYLFTQGRRLGPPVLISDPHRRRAAVEHIEAMASLAQRAGHRDGIARYQKGRLKRRLGQAWRVSAELDDAAFAASLTQQARLSPEQANGLRELLARFDAVRDETELVQLVSDAARYTAE